MERPPTENPDLAQDPRWRQVAGWACIVAWVTLSLWCLRTVGSAFSLRESIDETVAWLNDTSHVRRSVGSVEAGAGTGTPASRREDVRRVRADHLSRQLHERAPLPEGIAESELVLWSETAIELDEAILAWLLATGGDDPALQTALAMGLETAREAYVNALDAVVTHVQYELAARSQDLGSMWSRLTVLASLLLVVSGALVISFLRTRRHARELRSAYVELTHVVQRQAEAESKLRASRERFDLALRGSRDGIWDWEADTDQMYFSDRFKELLGYEEDDPFAGELEQFREIIHPDDRERTLRCIRNHLVYHAPYDLDHRLRLKSGEFKWFQTRGQAVWDSQGRALRMAGSITDISARAQTQERLEDEMVRLERDAQVDPLTDLFNRRGLERILEGDKSLSTREGGRLVAILADLDDFKTVNDTHGYAVGDAVLQGVAQHIKDSVRPSDHAARVGGDEFLILLPRTRYAEARLVAERIRGNVARMSVRAGDGVAKITISLGVAGVDGGKPTIEEIVTATRLAIGRSKHTGKNRVSITNDDEATECSEELDDVSEQLVRGAGFRPVFQPIVALSDERIVGQEVLIRGPVGVNESPEDLFRTCTEKGILTTVDLKCLQLGVEGALFRGEAATYHFNLYPSTLLHTPHERLMDIFSHLKIESEICIEISEQQLIGEPRRLQQALEPLREAGFRLAIDDVGFGRSSLESLLVLHPDVVKIDRQFITGASAEPATRRALTRLLKVVRSLGSEPLAEGIETREDLALLREMGVAYGQGFLWGRPCADPAAQRTRAERA